MRLLFAGTPATALPALDTLLASPHQVVAVLSRPDARSGRGRTPSSSPVKARALEAGLEVFTPAQPGDPDFLDRLRALDVDVCPILAYGGLIPRAALDIPRLGWVNLHFSLLPAWRGAAPVQRALMAGDDVTGATTFVLEETLDTGPVIGQVTETVRPDDTAGALLERLSHSGSGLLLASLDAMAEGRARPLPQPTDGVSYAPKVTVEDARVRWSEPAVGVDRRVRACTPDPGAWTDFRGDRLKIGRLVPVRGADRLPPGQLRVTKSEVLVGTATEPVRLEQVQPPGRRPMGGADWARGVRVAGDEALGG